MNNFHTLTDAEYKSQRTAVISNAEGSENRIYFDTANRPHPTIGIGFNLDDLAVRTAVLKGIGIDPALSNTNLTPQQRALEQGYQQDIIDTITQFDPMGPTYDTDGSGTLSDTERAAAESALQTSLNTIMATRADNPLMHGIANRREFRFLSTNEMQDALGVVVGSPTTARSKEALVRVKGSEPFKSYEGGYLLKGADPFYQG